MATRALNRTVRQRKLSTKVNLHIYREDEIDLQPDTAVTVETGVERAEETEHHLQQIIGAAQATAAANKVYIPTRETAESTLSYDEYYSRHFAQPATYIRFSATVEDSVGPAYCMNEDDEGFLKAYNAKKKKDLQCSEDQFEEVMSYFEETAATKQPFAAIGDSQPLSFEDLDSAHDETLTEYPKRFAKDIYEHWRTQRIKRDNQPLMPTLRFERNVDTDESDPYVCFRRREIRQARKTRGRDAQVTEKLRRLRIELEQGRQLLHYVKQRELGRRDQLAGDRTIFEQRTKFKEIKRHLGNKEGDEDLINQKPSPKPKPTLPSALQRLPPGAQFPGQRAVRTDGLAIRASDAEYTQLEDIRSRTADSIKSFVRDNMVKHTAWNQGWVDDTWRPITPPLDSPDDESDVDPLGTELRGWKHIDPTFGAGTDAQGPGSLPTPPASVASPVADDENATAGEGDKAGPPARNTRSRQPSIPEKPVVRFASPPAEPISPQPIRPVFRQRRGRGGRLMIDRRAPKRTYPQAFPEPSPLSVSHPALALHPYNLRTQKSNDDDTDSAIDMTDPYSATLAELRQLDRFAFDNDDDDEEDEEHRQRIYTTDAYENMNIRYRMMWSRTGNEDQRQAQLAAQRQRQSIAGQGGQGAAAPQAQAVRAGG